MTLPVGHHHGREAGRGKAPRRGRLLQQLYGRRASCRLALENRVIDLQAHWWGIWIAPSITLAVAAVISKVGGMLVRRSGARSEGSWGVSLSRLAEADAVARTFQVAFLTLTTLMVLCFTARSDRLTCFLGSAYCCAAGLLLVIGFREGATRGKGWLQNAFLLAVAFGVAFSLMVGIIAHVGIDDVVNEYIQAH